MIELPIRIRPTPNMREHWAAKAKRAKLQRESVRWAMGPVVKPALPCIVRLVRIAPRELDTDNLAAGMKHCRDGMADWLGINDNDPRVTWEYGQCKGKPKQYAVRVEIQLPLPGA